MNNISDYLEFYFRVDYYQNSAQRVPSISLKNRVNKHLNVLEYICNKSEIKSFHYSGRKLIPEIFRKAKKQIKETNEVKLNKSELRTLSYALNYSEGDQSSFFANHEELRIIFHAFDSNWRDYYTLGLFDCYLKNWESKHISGEILGIYVLRKLENYIGRRSMLRKLNENIKYFDKKNGDLVLGREIALKNVLISNSTKYLSLPDHFFTYPYFSKVILSFYEKNRNSIAEHLQDIANSLEIHNNNRTNKKIISKLIIQANSIEFSTLRDTIKKMAFKFVGDPSISAYWLPDENFSESEKNDLKLAKKYLNEWITEQFIYVFFEKCINDVRRKRFWSKYAKKIMRFKVFGSIYTKKLLKSDQRIAEFVDDRFHVVNSTSDVSAFMFSMGEYKFIEFSDPGYAFYAYKSSNKSAPSFDNQHVYSVDSFRGNTKKMLVRRSGNYFYSYSDEGRLTHRDGNMSWEAVFSNWLSRIVGINV